LARDPGLEFAALSLQQAKSNYLRALRNPAAARTCHLAAFTSYHSVLPLAAMVACSRIAALFAACSAWGAHGAPDAQGSTEELLAADNECLAGADPSSCGLNALQMRAKKAAGLPAMPGLPPLDLDPEPEEDEDDDDDKDDDESKNDQPKAQQPQEQKPKAAKPTQSKTPAGPKLKPNPPTPVPLTYTTLSPIVVKGNFLYDSATGNRWFSKGTSYNPRSSTFNPNGRSKGRGCEPGDAKYTGYTADIIADEFEARWSEDLEAIANMGANTVRLFNVDAGRDHTKFMKKAESLGIYVIVPLNSKDYGFLPAFPSPRCYTENMTFQVAAADGSTRPYGNVGVNVLSYGKQIVKQFSKFDNTLFFTVNNEFAMHDKNGFAGFQCVKALTRDIHQYQKSCSENMRRVPLIYSDYDMGAPDRGEIAKYLTCALESEDDAIDVYGLNAYSYCNQAYPGGAKADNFDYSPYKDIRKDFADLPVPMLFTEFGCVEGDFLSFCPYKGGRTWPDVKWFFNSEMGEIVSGAIAYTYEQDYEERGMVLTPGFLKGQEKLYLLDNYYALQKQFMSHNVSTKWDGADIADCKWTPDKVAPQQASHKRQTCPSTKAGHAVMERRRVDTITDWHKLPPSPDAPLANINGQSECPAGKVAATIAEESQCHFKK